MNAVVEFFAMGGYAVYVWSSYAIAAIILLFNFLYARHQSNLTHREIKHDQSLNAQDLQK